MKRLASLWQPLLHLLGGLFVLDGATLLWRGIVGGLFLFHEAYTAAFLIGFVLHTLVGGAAYLVFGYHLLRDRPWTRGLAGRLMAASAVVWAHPALGGDFFSAALGVGYALCAVWSRFDAQKG